MIGSHKITTAVNEKTIFSICSNSSEFMMAPSPISPDDMSDSVAFCMNDLPADGYMAMESIRRQGKLCDVTLKVNGAMTCAK